MAKASKAGIRIDSRILSQKLHAYFRNLDSYHCIDTYLLGTNMY